MPHSVRQAHAQQRPVCSIMLVCIASSMEYSYDFEKRAVCPRLQRVLIGEQRPPIRQTAWAPVCCRSGTMSARPSNTAGHARLTVSAAALQPGHQLDCINDAQLLAGAKPAAKVVEWSDYVKAQQDAERMVEASAVELEVMAQSHAKVVSRLFKLMPLNEVKVSDQVRVNDNLIVVTCHNSILKS